MSDVIEYKCPFCGGAMEFDSKSQHMKCLYCNTEMTVEEFQRTQKPEAETAAEKKTAKENWFSLSSGQWQKDETNHMRVYSCQSCGGEIVADETTGATTCPFCNNKVTIKGQFSGDLKPDYIIPFKLDKKAAKKRYYSHLEGRKYLPKVFRKENHVDEIKGVYIPFWLFDVDADVQITYEAEKVHVQESNDTEYTTRDIYRVVRAGSISFEHIPADASRKMDDTLMEAIEPFHFRDAVPFQPAYLAGYLADRYDVSLDERMDRARKRIRASVNKERIVHFSRRFGHREGCGVGKIVVAADHEGIESILRI